MLPVPPLQGTVWCIPFETKLDPVSPESVQKVKSSCPAVCNIENHPKPKNKPSNPPIIGPDVGVQYLLILVIASLKNNINGIILTNTSDKNRDKLIDNQKNEKGGLSGQPIKDLSTKIIKKFYKKLNGKIPIIGVGGVDSGNAAFEKIAAGASAIQLYTGMIYKGPMIVKEIKKGLIIKLNEKGFKNISEAVGSNSN